MEATATASLTGNRNLSFLGGYSGTGSLFNFCLLFGELLFLLVGLWVGWQERRIRMTSFFELESALPQRRAPSQLHSSSMGRH